MEDLSCFGGINLDDLFGVEEICRGKKEPVEVPPSAGDDGDDETKLRELLMSLS